MTSLFYLVLCTMIFFLIVTKISIFFSTAGASDLKHDSDSIQIDISGMNMEWYVYCLLLTHFNFEIEWTHCTYIVIIQMVFI